MNECTALVNKNMDSTPPALIECGALQYRTGLCTQDSVRALDWICWFYLTEENNCYTVNCRRNAAARGASPTQSTVSGGMRHLCHLIECDTSVPNFPAALQPCVAVRRFVVFKKQTKLCALLL